ncbi:ABC transporter permease [Marinobacterium jannaschii]|uniref:ABC transporter permease n=1 Tax=Marinobacterium jannaschii TaxID=64970 RepID=UPI000482D63E|nr:ABC transporter permease [Marinobacterium jannaschii]
MNLIDYFLQNQDLVLMRTFEHIALVACAVGLAILVGVPTGVAITQNKLIADMVLYLGSVVITIPSIALFGLMIPILSQIGQGIGYVPAVIAVFLYALLPIVRNTYTAITDVDPALREAARGVGMSALQRLYKVEIPLSLPVIMAGVRSAVVINIGVMAIAAYIGAGGLGSIISRGISQSDPVQIFAGAITVSVLAIITDGALFLLQKKVTPPGQASH